MSKYIDADNLKANIESIINSDHPIEYDLMEKRAYDRALSDVIDLIDSHQQEQPEYGYLSTTYIHGKKARWNVGDTLAYYLCTSNEEGEIIIGKITKVEFSNEEGWIYTFEDESTWDEPDLAAEGVYKIIENGK